MKRLIANSAILATLGTSAFAMESREQLQNHVKLQITQMVPNADLDSLTNIQVAAIYGLFSKSENLRFGNDPAGQLKVILGWE